MQKNKVMKAYLIGNGASIPYGSPLGSDLFRRALELFYEGWKYYHDNRYCRLKDYLNKMIGNLDDLRNQVIWGDLNFLHMGKFSKKFDCLINPQTSHSERVNIYREIEDYFSKFEIWKLFPEIIGYYNDNEKHGYRNCKSKRLALLEGRSNLFNEIADFSFKTIYFAIKYSNCNPDYYKNFVRAIGNSFEDTVIINLNYDNLLEKALKRNFKGIVEYEFGDKIQCFPSPQFGEDSGQKILLLKPHGSFDFLFCDKCNCITLSEDIPLEYLQNSTDKRQCKNPNCKNRNLPNFFIPYTDITLPIRYRAVLSSVVEKMKEILKPIREITTIGYSFSEYKGDLIDKHLKFIFEKRKVTVVAKNISRAEKICADLGKFSINAENSGFNGFADFVRHMNNNFFS